MVNNFNSIASHYDRLSKIVFGRSMHKAQTSFLKRIDSHANVLMLGGGTGWLLAEVLRINPSCRVWYIEASDKMIELSKNKVRDSGNRVIFIHGTEASIPEGIFFNVVITHFYLDLFASEYCNKVIDKIKTSMDVRGIWLVCDFVKTTWWHSLMLFLMYQFFKITCKIETNTLPAWKQLITESGFVEVASKNFFRRFIRSSVFRLIPES